MLSLIKSLANPCAPGTWLELPSQPDSAPARNNYFRLLFFSQVSI